MGKLSATRSAAASAPGRKLGVGGSHVGNKFGSYLLGLLSAAGRVDWHDSLGEGRLLC